MGTDGTGSLGSSAWVPALEQVHRPSIRFKSDSSSEDVATGRGYVRYVLEMFCGTKSIPKDWIRGNRFRYVTKQATHLDHPKHQRRPRQWPPVQCLK